MYDTVALMGPPIAYTLSRLAGVNPKLMFLPLAFSLTIGSVMTPIGNPQNVLIAVESCVEAPFIAFLATGSMVVSIAPMLRRIPRLCTSDFLSDLSVASLCLIIELSFEELSEGDPYDLAP